MIREVVLRDFQNWDAEKQLSEFQAYKAIGDYSPFSEADYKLMEMVMTNPNAEVECENGICEINLAETKEESEVECDNGECTLVEEDDSIQYDDTQFKENLRLVEFVDTFYAINNHKLDENLIEKLKDSIIGMIEKIADSTILNKIKSLLAMTDEGNLTRLIGELQNKKGFSTKDIRSFKAIILEDHSSLEEKEEFIELLVSEKYAITKQSIIGSKDRTRLADLVPTEISKLEIFRNTFQDFLEVLLDDGTGTGKGEFFIALFGKKIKTKGTPGDLQIDGLNLEIKGKNARLQGQNGFGLSTGAFQYLTKVVKKYGKVAEEKGIEIPDVSNPNNFNFKKSGKSDLTILFEFFNETFKQKITKKDGIEYLAEAFNIIYMDASENDIIEKLIKPSLNNKKLDIKMMDRNLVIFNFYYYQNKEDFEGVIFINTAKSDFPIIYISDYKDFEQTLNLFRFEGFSWKDRGSNVHRLLLK